jgi:hypothetical protein
VLDRHVALEQLLADLEPLPPGAVDQLHVLFAEHEVEVAAGGAVLERQHVLPRGYGAGLGAGVAGEQGLDALRLEAFVGDLRDVRDRVLAERWRRRPRRRRSA